MPRLLLATVAALALAAPAEAITFNYTGSIVTWTAPQDGIYSIAATGAQGGQGRNPQFAAVYTAGRGIRVGADFMLTAGTVLQIAVGGQGGSFLSGTDGGGGGGGGSFVVGPDNTPLVVGAGGGGVNQGSLENGWDATAGPALSGDSFVTSIVEQVAVITRIPGGTPLFNTGQGGPASTPSTHSGGGAGFYSDGESGIGAPGGRSWLNGLAGGLAGCPTGNGGLGSGDGGFGGGGAGGCTVGGGGGGGGYSGGQGGISAGGGGGSYVYAEVPSYAPPPLPSFNPATSNQFYQFGVGYGDGIVTITWAGEEVSTAIPEPASATLALLGLFGLAASRRRRR